jgi:V/A-type H+-transporting ATPase subunit A
VAVLLRARRTRPPQGRQRYGSVTIGGTVSPAGGNFDEPVTQATLKVVGAFHGLSRARSDARRYPAIDPLDSWSKYTGVAPTRRDRQRSMRDFLRRGSDVAQMMKVVGEEGTSMDDFNRYTLKSELVDAVYLQQDAFNKVDCSPTAGQAPARGLRQRSDDSRHRLRSSTTKDAARRFFLTLTQAFKRLAHAPWEDRGLRTSQPKKYRLAVAEGSRHA